MANKKINQLSVRTGAALTDLSLVGDPTSGTSFKLTLQDISTLMGVPGKFNQPTGTTAQYLRGDGSLATFPSLTGFVPYTGATSNVNLGEFGLATGQVTLDTTPTGTPVVGTTRWNDTIGSSETTLKGSSVVLKNGVDLVARVVNKVSPNATLTKAAYQAVRVSGAQGQRLAVAYAQANNDANSADTIGLVCETIPTNQEGFIITMGQLENINTTGSLQGETWADGDVLYLSPFTPGAITKVKPTGAGHIVVVGYVEYAHVNNGIIYVKVMNGWELDELHDVDIVSPANNQALIYESSTALWKNKTIATALGYTPVPTTRTLTINGTAFDLSADRSWTVSSDNIYTANGTLTSARTLTSGGFPLTFTGSNTAATAIARGLNLTHTLVAAANNDVLIGLDINPTFTNAAFTGVRNAGARVRTDNLTAFIAEASTTAPNFPSFVVRNSIGRSGIFSQGSSIDGSGHINSTVIASIDGNLNLCAGFDVSSGGSYVMKFSTGGFSMTGTERMRLTAAGRLLLGTTTEGTFLLDVNGTARVSGLLNLGGWSLSVQSTSGTTALVVKTPPSGRYLLFAREDAATGLGNFQYAAISNGDSRFVFSSSDSFSGSPTSSALISMVSTTQGFLPPRLTTTQKNAIATPAAGLQVYDTTLNQMSYYNGTTWVNF